MERVVRCLERMGKYLSREETDYTQVKGRRKVQEGFGYISCTMIPFIAICQGCV